MDFRLLFIYKPLGGLTKKKRDFNFSALKKIAPFFYWKVKLKRKVLALKHTQIGDDHHSFISINNNEVKKIKIEDCG